MVTLARDPLDKCLEPLKIRSRPDLPRIDFIDCSPKTYRMASATFDVPEPLGPTMQTIGLSNCKVVFWAKDLKPFNSRVLSRIQDIISYLPGSETFFKKLYFRV